MALTEQEVREIKDQLLKQLSNFPEDKQAQIKEQVESMTPEQVEEFVKQNQLTHLGGQCVFCAIIGGKIPSYEIGGDKENIAILELNPLSKGHALIVPKEHADKIGDSTQKLAKEVSIKLQEKFNPQKIEVQETKIMEHPLLEIIPIYGDETERAKATDDELKALQEEITKDSPVETQPKEEVPELEEEIFKMPPRIP
jgi:histidine triad (HIT) family protein